MTRVNDWQEMTCSRLLDFFSSRSRWHRRLWNPGLVLSLHEILEAAAAVESGIISADALGVAVRGILKTAPLDLGLGDRTNLKALQQALQTKLRNGGLDYLAVKQLTALIEEAYLSQWAGALADPETDVNPERISRAIAAHLLDLGFNSDFLHRWWTFRLNHREPRSSLADLVAEAHDLCASPLAEYTVLVAFESVPVIKFGRPNGWIGPRDVSLWLQNHGFDNSNVRQVGGVILKLRARDPRAAS